MTSCLDIRPGEQVALVGGNASRKSRLAAAFAGRCGAKYISFRDSYGSYGDRNFFMQQRWNLFTLEGDPPSVGEALRESAAESTDPVAAERNLHGLIDLFSMGPLLDKPLVSLSSGSPAGSSACAWSPAPLSRIRLCISWTNPCRAWTRTIGTM